MSERLSDKLREFLKSAEGRDVSLADLRKELNIDPNHPAWDSLRVLMHNFSKGDGKLVRPSGRKDGVYRVIRQVKPVPVYSVQRERRPIFDLKFPKDFDTGMEMDFANKLIIREGDLITLGGVKSKCKTLLCLNFAGENIDKAPILMGNEYTVSTEGSYEPAPRFLLRLDKMKAWVNWTDEKGFDRFVLLPVRDDYAEHIVRDRINIIDWVNIDASQLYDISRVLESIKANLGRGIAIIALQKGEGVTNPRGGQFVRDFSDLEILLDGLGDSDDEILLTIKGAKEKTAPIVGKTYAFLVGGSGTQVLNFREVKKCPDCRGSGYKQGKECDRCFGRKYIDGGDNG